jgi:hypothetical protein
MIYRKFVQIFIVPVKHKKGYPQKKKHKKGQSNHLLPDPDLNWCVIFSFSAAPKETLTNTSTDS